MPPTSNQTASEPDQTQSTTTNHTQPTLLVPWTSDALCVLCRVVARSATAPINVSEQQLKTSAARGCALCRFFYEELVMNSFRSPERHAYLEVTRRNDDITVIDQNDKRHHFEVYSVEPIDSLEIRHCLYRQIQTHPDHEPCWTLIRLWLARCESSHPACCQELEVTKPTRLIDVRSLRLVHGSSCHSSERYATLSHCWGSRPFTKTTTSILRLFRTSLDLHSLPQTFQDAIFVTQKLGLKYLWIDALCIIQDDAEDWNTEAANMGIYYRQAYVNLSALSSADAHNGFLHHRQLRTSMDLGDALRIRRARPSWTDVLHNAPLSRRGWVLQERLLSTRVLHFGKDELFWECLTTFGRESSCVESSRDVELDLQTEESFKRCFAFGNVTDSDKEWYTANLMEPWNRIVHMYSTLDLSVQGDRFPAIAGIAQKIGEVTGYTYIAGLWLEHIHIGLLWHAETSTSRQESATQAPSWSWASLGGPVGWKYGSKTYVRSLPLEMKISEATVFHSEETDIFTHGEGAELTIDAYCFTVWCRSSSTGHAPYSDPYLTMIIDIFDERGIFVGTGHWDRSPDNPIIQCTAIVVCQQVDEVFGETPIISFLLAKDMGGHIIRTGIGHTADEMYGRVSDVLDLEKLDRKQFLLR